MKSTYKKEKKPRENFFYFIFPLFSGGYMIACDTR